MLTMKMCLSELYHNVMWLRVKETVKVSRNIGSYWCYTFLNGFRDNCHVFSVRQKLHAYYTNMFALPLAGNIMYTSQTAAWHQAHTNVAILGTADLHYNHFAEMYY